MSKLKLLVMAGGKSGEHEVSITSARCVLDALRASNIEASVQVVAKDGTWLDSKGSTQALQSGAAPSGGRPTLEGVQNLAGYDVVFPLIHGPFGEDGTLQGLLEYADIPYIGSGVLASSLCMDKPLAKDTLRAYDIPQTAYALVTRAGYGAAPADTVTRCAALPRPWFVKPANLGSSVGISKALDTDGLKAAIEYALQHDRRVIVDQGVVDAREVEIGVIGNEAPKASCVGEITYDAEFYDYDTKYTDGRAQLHIPADIPADVVARMEELAKRAFIALDCAGFARVDFFYRDADQQLFLNEVNTIPGFTPTSMFTRVWEHSGLAYAALVEELAHLAQQRHN